ncbi:sulfotransferase [Nocardioides sp. R-C-SC26]|uniref:sulfotransferase n=1 Tax=Nocardioides sp. R-C-SC26 TaxID=2870414 RepID=UPI001E5CFC33|nr:sulfotransferase [Nocardioides sp. R-C-SC26]
MTGPGAGGELDALHAENARLRERVQRLRARNGESDLDYLFVVTYGRSGSTLVSGLLNAIPGYLIRGENRDALRHLFDFHRQLQVNARGPKANFRQRTHPFFGAGDFPEDRSLAGIRRLVLDTVLRPKADTRVVGFKEITWFNEERDDLGEYVAWLREVFPGARFLVNTRNLDDVGRSSWWGEGDADQVAANRRHLQANETALTTLADDLGAAAYRIHYDDYVADPGALAGLFAWLGEPFDLDAVRAVLEVRHSI